MLTVTKRAFIIYCVVRAADLLLMTAGLPGERKLFAIWGGYYGLWALVLEFCLAAASLYLLSKNSSSHIRAGTLCGISAVVTAKASTTLQGFSIPRFPWEGFAAYLPAPVEILAIPAAILLMIFAYSWVARRFKVSRPETNLR